MSVAERVGRKVRSAAREVLEAKSMSFLLIQVLRPDLGAALLA